MFSALRVLKPILSITIMTIVSKLRLSVYRMSSRQSSSRDLLIVKDPRLRSSQPLLPLTLLGFTSRVDLSRLDDLGFGGHLLR